MLTKTDAEKLVHAFVSSRLDYCNVGLSRFVVNRRLKKIVDLILLTSTNRQNTGSGAFHGRFTVVSLPHSGFYYFQEILDFLTDTELISVIWTMR